jgi:hypothetical protein
MRCENSFEYLKLNIISQFVIISVSFGGSGQKP